MFGINKAKKEDYNFVYARREDKYNAVSLMCYSYELMDKVYYKEEKLKDLLEKDYRNEVWHTFYATHSSTLKTSMTLQSGDYDGKGVCAAMYLYDISTIIGPNTPDFRYSYILDPEKCKGTPEYEKYVLLNKKLNFCWNMYDFYFSMPTYEQDFSKIDYSLYGKTELPYLMKCDYVSSIMYRDIAERKTNRCEFRKQYFLFEKEHLKKIWDWVNQNITNEELLSIDSTKSYFVYMIPFLNRINDCVPIFHEDPEFLKLIEPQNLDVNEWGRGCNSQTKADNMRSAVVKKALKTGNKNNEWGGDPSVEYEVL